MNLRSSLQEKQAELSNEMMEVTTYWLFFSLQVMVLLLRKFNFCEVAD